MYRFLLSRQWVILTLITLALVPTMIELGFWQLHRHEHKVALNKVISESLAAKPVPAESLTAPGRPVERAELYRRVTAKGVFDTAHEVVVRRRTSSDDEVGFHVLTPFVLDDGRVLMVNRGWIPAEGAQTEFPRIPAPARGETTVTGRLKADETTAGSGIKDVSGLPDRQVMLINSAERAKALDREVLGGYVELTSPEPKGDTPELLGAPDHNGIGPHMAYAVQWWLFAAGVPVGWVILVRRELRDRAEAAATATATAPESEPAAV
ncbi:SURF1 family cytochrome oxidase biogenesis protein [Streptomyces fructofermentans]|uniref:SURF1-like protein n=1 Tax=Streptomyces fructofermentans TaxID=152141 RepID=A0A918NKI4_9ACTN|nr:SURF1 family protein [Streptomyces fructofermentans]GGX75564.1 SURF1-like protein [Streptomyces fructofermentans]